MTKETRIVDRCPSCGKTTLFVGEGGYLTCSFLGCPEPGVGRVIERMQREFEEARPVLEAARDEARLGLAYTAARSPNRELAWHLWLASAAKLESRIREYDAAHAVEEGGR
jgi:hypothetical protein